jgi:hypothetical protein
LTQIYTQTIKNENNDDDDERENPANIEINKNDPRRLDNVMDPNNENLISYHQQRSNLFLEINNNNKKPFSCPKCERTFNSKYNVARHLRQFHADKRMFKCLVCGRDYKWIDSLHKHAKSHNNNNDLKTNLMIRENEVEAKEKNSIYSYVTLTNEDNDDDDDEQTTLIDLSNDDSKTC